MVTNVNGVDVLFAPGADGGGHARIGWYSSPALEYARHTYDMIVCGYRQRIRRLEFEHGAPGERASAGHDE